MRGCAHAIQFIHVDPANGARGFIHLSRVDEQDELGREATQFCRAIFRGVARIHNEDMFKVAREARLKQGARDQNPGRVIRAEGVADPDDGDPG